MLDRFLRAGGVGMVWAGRDLRPRNGDSPHVALKAVDAAAGGADAAEREAEVAARVRHPGVVRVREVFVEEGLAWLVMDRALGSLADVVERGGPLPPPVALGCALQAADALAAAHAVGVVHRDVKPHNLLVFPGGGVRLTDFGAARALSHGGTRTRTAAVLGTIAFMAPEQRRDPRAVRPATDVYALAVTLAWLLLGEPPDEPWTDEAAAQLAAAGVPGPLRAVLAAAGARRPEDRPPDAAAFAHALRGCGVPAVDGLGPWLDAWPADAPSAPPSAVSGPLVPPATGASGAPRGGLAQGVALGAAGAALVGALGAWAWPAPVESEALRDFREWDALPLCGDAPQQVVWRQYPTQASDPPSLAEAAGVAVGDLDGDGHVDFVVSHVLGARVLVWWGPFARDGWFAGRSEIDLGRASGAVALGDVDGDGHADLAQVRGEGGGIAVQRMVGREPVGEPLLVEQGAEPQEIAIADWDGDGQNELFVRVSNGTLSLRRYSGGGFSPPAAVAGEVKAVGGGPAGLWAVTTGGALLSFTAGRAEARQAIPGGMQVEVVSPGEEVGSVRFLGEVAAGWVGLRLRDGQWCRYPAEASRPHAVLDLDASGVVDYFRFASCAYCDSAYQVGVGTGRGVGGAPGAAPGAAR